MSEETLSEEELNAKIMGVVEALEEIGERGLANKLFKKLSDKIEFVDLGDDEWYKHQICETYPKCDLRTIVYCCAPTNPCPYRNSVLRKLNLTIADYIQLKEKFGSEMGTLLKLSLPTGH